MNKDNYIFSIIDKKTRRVQFKKYLWDVNDTEAIVIAEDYLMNDPTINKILKIRKGIIILIRKYASNISYQIQDNIQILSNGKVNHKEWKYYISEKEIDVKNKEIKFKDKPHIYKVAFFSSIIFAAFLLILFFITAALTLLENNKSTSVPSEEIQNSLSIPIDVLSLLIFLIGLLYNGIASLVKNELIASSTNKFDVIKYNFFKEIPFFFAIAATLLSFYGKEIASIFPSGMAGLTVLAVFFAVFKVIMEIMLDLEQLSKKN